MSWSLPSTHNSLACTSLLHLTCLSSLSSYPIAYNFVEPSSFVYKLFSQRAFNGCETRLYYSTLHEECRKGVSGRQFVMPEKSTVQIPKHSANCRGGKWERGQTKNCACGTWQFCLHNGEPCGFVTFLCISVATHVTACGVRVITMKRRIRFGSVRG